MQPERFKRTKSVVASSAIAFVVAALVIGLSSLVLGPRSASPQRPSFDLTSNPSTFTIASVIYASPACSGSPALLLPGITRCAVFSVHNLLTVPISVQSITSALDTSYPSPPANCAPPTYFTLPTFSGSVTVGAGATTALPGVTIKLLDSHSIQDNCQGFTYHFAYTGSAQYTDSTTAVLTSAPHPSALGSSVTLTATVTAGNPSIDTSLPSGTVSFYKCTSATVCPNSGTPLGTGTIGSGGKATYLTMPSQLTQGLNYIDAVYPASGTNFTGATSNVVTQDVQAGTTAALTSAANPSTSGRSVTFTATVTKTGGTGTPTGSVSFYSGAPTGTHTLRATMGLNASAVATYTTSSSPPLTLGTESFYAVYNGDNNFSGSISPVLNQVVTSAACLNGTINGGYTVPSGQFMCITGRVNGGITVRSGSGLYLNGATVNGGIVSTGATAFTSCASTINGNLAISGTTGPVLIGDGGDNQPTGDDPLPACKANTINASSISITNNTGGVEFGSNTVNGSLSLTRNTSAVGPEVEANKITGNLACSGNLAAPTNDTLKNTVAGTKSGQCTGSAF
jgi:Bacterial Ig-like domain (group 3)